MPSALVTAATSLTVTVTFQTTSDGVILGYQNQPAGIAPNQYVPALYVGTDSLLHAEIYDGSFRQMVGATKVNDGHEHTAKLVETGSSQSLYLDNVLIATLNGTPIPLSMTFDQLGTGYTLSYPNTPGRYFPFTGTIDSIQIVDGASPSGSFAFPASGGATTTFTPPVAGTYTISLLATNPDGGTAVTASNPLTVIAAPPPPPPVIQLPTTTVQAVQGQAFSLSGSFTDTAQWSSYDLNAQYGDGSGNRVYGNPFTISHTYASAGDFTVTMNFTDSLGNVAHATFQVIVSGFSTNDASSQPSAVSSLTYTFANPVQVKPGAFELLRNGRRSPIRLVLDEQPDRQNFLITFEGSGVVDGSIPDGSYKLITLHKKVTVLSGPKMTQNDVNRFVSRSAGAHGGKKDIGAPRKHGKGELGPPEGLSEVPWSDRASWRDPKRIGSGRAGGRHPVKLMDRPQISGNLPIRRRHARPD